MSRLRVVDTAPAHYTADVEFAVGEIEYEDRSAVQVGLYVGPLHMNVSVSPIAARHLAAALLASADECEAASVPVEAVHS